MWFQSRSRRGASVHGMLHEHEKHIVISSHVFVSNPFAAPSGAPRQHHVWHRLRYAKVELGTDKR